MALFESENSSRRAIPVAFPSMLILESTHAVVEQANHVRIDDDAIRRWARTVSADDLRPVHHALPAELPGSRKELANLVLLMDALNFCFWSPDPITTAWRGRTYHRFEAMFVSLMIAARRDRQWFDPQFWIDAPSQTLRDALCDKGTLLMLDERERIIRETGRTLVDRFEGQFAGAVESVSHKAWPLAVLLMTNFDSFRDVGEYLGRPLYFLKRAQICALDLSIAWETHGHAALAGTEELTAFADYRLPQALRHLEILRLKPDLVDAIDGGREIEKDSEQEIELRSATIHAVERMRRSAADAGVDVPAWQIDWYLWGLSHGADIAANHHRIRTVNY